MAQLQYELAQLSQPNNPNRNNQLNGNQSNNKNGDPNNQNSRQLNGKLIKQSNGQIFKDTLVSPTDELSINLPDNKKRARVLYDYQAQDNNELNLSTNEIVIINLDDTDATGDFLTAERGLERGKVPISYLEIMS